MSHALLLRLFLSPSFFSVHVALQYLRTYGDHVGITHYLTGRLREMDPSEVEALWGLVCHLLVTRPSKSAALECFVLERAEQSAHVAMLTLWFMQAALGDLSMTRRGTPSFAICQRVLNRCHGIIFDLPSRSVTAFVSGAGATRKPKVKARLGPAIVGMGTALGGVGVPQLNVVGDWAVKQGAAAQEGRAIGVVVSAEDGDLPAPSRVYEQGDVLPEEDGPEPEPEPDPDEEDIDSPLPDLDPALASEPMANHSTVSLMNHSTPPRRPPGPHQTSPSLPFELPSRLARPIDPLGQLDPNPSPTSPAYSKTLHSRFSSSPSIPSAFKQSTDIQLLARYPNEMQVALLRGHYFKSEIRFLLALESIANHLLVIPKPARVSALRAELTSLNHQLPSEICLPMWCPSTDSAKCHAHHRIVRIPAGECVVLNSAERAPYLLYVELLQGDLDFVPSKRSNRELLRKMMQEQQVEEVRFDAADRRPRKEDVRPFSSTQQAALGQLPLEPQQTQLLPPPVILTTIPPTPDTSARPSLADDGEEEEEEMDLVEQLYGSDLSVRTHAADLTDSIVLPAPPKNKDLDVATWSRSHPSSPRMDFVMESTPTRRPSYGTPKINGSGPSPHSQFPTPPLDGEAGGDHPPVLSLEDYSERMRTAAVMLAQLNASLAREPVTTVGSPATESTSSFGGVLSWLPGTARSLANSPVVPSATPSGRPSIDGSPAVTPAASVRLKLQPAEAAAIRERIMKEMMSLEEERMQRMREAEGEDVGLGLAGNASRKTAEDETIVRRELNKSDPSAAVFKEAWAIKKARIRATSPYGHLATWECVSVIVKTGADLRQEQLATQLIREFERIWREENCQCWARSFRILITGGSSGLVETVTDAVSIHSIKKAEYAKRLAEGRFGNVTLMDHFVATYGDPSSPRYIRAQRNFARSLAGYSVITFILQIKDRHNGNILLDREGRLIHIDFGFMLSNSPGGNMGFEAAPFKLPMEYIDVLGGMDSPHFTEFKTLFREGFEAARKHCDSIITIVELMQKDSALPCFGILGEQTANALRERFQPALTHSLIGDYVERLIISSMGSTWTRLYDSYQYYSQSIL